MDALEAIYGRRSIRQYTAEAVSEKLLEKLLKAAMSAPSAGNEQPWHFVVIDDRQMLNDITMVHPYAEMLKQAPLAILVCGDPDLEKHPGNWVIDCSAAVENILIAAHALGLGTVWLGVYPRTDRMAGISRLAALPDRILPLALIAVGYSAEQKTPSDRYQLSRIHRNQW